MLGQDLVDGVAILTQLEAPVRAIAGTDTFTIRAGCDKRMATCGTKVANVANFRRFPNIPVQDAVLHHATKDDLRRFRHYRQFLNFCGMDRATVQSGVAHRA